MRSYLSDAGSVFTANVVTGLAGLATQSLLAWFLGPVGRGEYGACMLFVLVLMLSCTLGQEMANVYFVGSGKLTPSQAMTQSLLVGTLMSIAACGAGILITFGSFGFLQKAPIGTYRIALLCIPPMILTAYLNGILLGMRSVRFYTCLLAAPAVMGAVGTAVVGCFRPTVSLILPIHAASDFLAAIAAIVILRRQYGCRFTRIHAADLRRSLGYGLRFYLGKLFSMANLQIGNLILLISPVGKAELGLFSTASTIAGRLWLLPDTLHVALLPRSVSDPEGRSVFVARVCRLCLVCTAAMLLVMYLISKPFIAIIFSPEFLPVLIPFQLLLPGVLVRVVPKILTAFFNGIGRPGINSFAIAASVACNVVLMYLLLPRWGLIGVAVSMSVSYAVEALILATAFRLRTGLPFRCLILLTKEDGGLVREYWEKLRARLNRGPQSV
jgi:O-antigen/teichoic acid export membrane protein